MHGVQWHSAEDNVIQNELDISYFNVFENYLSYWAQNFTLAFTININLDKHYTDDITKATCWY